MKCDICGIHEAVLFVQQVTSTRTIEMHLCIECARARGISAGSSNVEVTLGNLLSGIMQDSSRVYGEQNLSCPVCGKKLTDLKKTKVAGCPECYTVFKSDVFSLLKAEGLEGTYSGSLPKKLAHFRSVLTDRMMLQSKLADAVAIEDYEKAAMYRDRLRSLDSSIPHPYSFGEDHE